jgi:hypothetical protein
MSLAIGNTVMEHNELLDRLDDKTSSAQDSTLGIRYNIILK